MFDNVKVSIVVPVYNVEKYLEECISSLVKQNYLNYEIIVVDDGSTDQSLSIIKKLATKYNEIKVFTKKNGGLSDARNYGIRMSRGDFIMFVDSDDFISEDLISDGINDLMRNNADVWIHNFQPVSDIGKNIEVKNFQKFVYSQLVEDGSTALNHLLTQKFPHFAPIGIYRRTLFSVNSITFPKGRRFEDSAVMYKIIGAAKRVCFSNNRGYFYRQNSSSIMHNVKFSDAEDLTTNCLELSEYIESNYPDKHQLKDIYIVARLLNAIIILYKLSDKTNAEKLFQKNIRSMILDKSRSCVVYEGLYKSQKIRILLLRFNLLELVYRVRMYGLR